MTEQVASTIEKFILNTIKGQESGLFKSIGSPMLSLPRDTLQKDSMRAIIGPAIANYFNGLYRSLIKGDDPYVVDNFNKMSKPLQHSKVCLLHTIFHLTITIHFNLKRQVLDIQNYNNYMAEIDKQLKENFKKYRPEIIKSISHTCEGEDIKKCDPNIDLFRISMQSMNI